jgi:hypothetical protein
LRHRQRRQLAASLPRRARRRAAPERAGQQDGRASDRGGRPKR